MREASRLLCLCIATLLWCKAHAQNQQVWLDYQINYPFANQYLFEMTTSYQTILSSNDKWRSMSLSPSFEYQFFTNVDLLAGLPIVYVAQAKGFNSLEVNPNLSARIHIRQNKRVDLRIIIKWEERFFRKIEDRDWESSNRVRLKAEALFAINGPNRYQDNLWHGILDYEEFFVIDDYIGERFANRRRGRLGAGYRLNYKHRFELIYSLQSSRNEIEGDFQTTDNVLQLRYKMFLNPATPATTDN